MTFDQLETLSDEVKTTFQPEFIFLIFPDKVQHFPVRDWKIGQFQDALTQHLGANYQLETWNGMVVARSRQKEVLAVLPRFHDLTELTLKKSIDS